MEYIIFWHDDEDKWCARNNGFKSPEESPEGFGDTPLKALEDLLELMGR